MIGLTDFRTHDNLIAIPRDVTDETIVAELNLRKHPDTLESSEVLNNSTNQPLLKTTLESQFPVYSNHTFNLPITYFLHK